jgi:hypothetical protein
MPLVPCQRKLQGTGGSRDGRGVGIEFGPDKVIIQRCLNNVDMETINKGINRAFSHNKNTDLNITKNFTSHLQTIY